MESAPAEAVFDAFREKGFEYIGSAGDGWIKLRGHLRPEPGQTVLCEIHLDPKFSEVPRVKLLELPPNLPPVVPHLSASGGLCYIAAGTKVLDIFDPVGQSLACLVKAEEVLGRIISDQMVDDLEDEFYAYWDGKLCLDDTEGDALGWQGCIVARGDEQNVWFATDNIERTRQKIKLLGLSDTNKTVSTCRVKTCARPSPSTKHWPPKTFGDLLNWQGALDLNCRRKILQRVEEGKDNQKAGVLILIKSPLMTYGFAILYDAKSRSRNRRRSLFQLEVLPVSVSRIDDGYIAQRNIPGMITLAGKEITLVGCGTIGGFLSEQLVKAGAGTLGGRLTIVDFDRLLPQNLGRHRLGFPDLLSNKAAAMKAELERVSPGVKIRALPVDVRDAQLGEIDLLINATGEASLGHWLGKTYSPIVPLLSVWIEGPGTAVRAILKSTAAGACHRCLWHSKKKGQLRSTIEPLPDVMAGQGCEGLYVPFPASVSIHAASLASEMALDWANGTVSPALRTRVLARGFQLGTPDCDPMIDPECPICNS